MLLAVSVGPKSRRATRLQTQFKRRSSVSMERTPDEVKSVYIAIANYIAAEYINMLFAI